MMRPSDKQRAIYDCWQHDDANILIDAVAGSGKTSTLLELLTMCNHRTLFLAFNKSIQVEIQAQIEERNLGQGKAMTMHSLGLQAIKKQTKVRINANKNYDLVKEIQQMHRLLFNDLRWEDKLKISYTLMDMNDVSRIYLTDDIEQIKKHMFDMDKTFFDRPLPGDWNDEETILSTVWSDMVELRNASYEGRKIEIDFQDMIFLPILKDYPIPIHPYYLMIDEVQDLNIAQHALIDKLISQGSIRRWIAVGDRNQAIYGFSGAYSSSFDKMLEKENVINLPLDICYRCPVDVINSANAVYPVMEAFKTHTGIVQNIPSYKHIKDESMVICRNSTPLLELYFLLLAEGKKVFIKGEDVLGSVYKFLRPYNYKTINTALVIMEKEERKLHSKLNNSDSDRYKYYRFKQNFDDFQVLVNYVCKDFNNTVDMLLKNIQTIFSNDSGKSIILCTIHKSKGLEADVVYILNEHLIPSKFAKSPAQLKQEQNLRYVARTRAKEEMYFLTM